MEAILCRTDLKIIRHGHRDPTLPRVPGEEVVGEVVPLGGDSPIAVGDRVYVYPGVWCGVCPSCCRGAENLCRKMRIMGFHRDGRARGARQARGVGGGAGRRARAAHGGRSPPGGTARRGRPGRL